MNKTAVVKFHSKPKYLNSVVSEEVLNSHKWSRMEVILKVTERCNIDCTYCYFFNSTNQDFKGHPAYIKPQTIEACAKFLAKTASDAETSFIQIDFRGGEPLMMKKNRFDEMCTVFRKYLGDVEDVQFVMQTNAMMIDNDWIEIFSKHKIGIGISLDGPKEFHDKNRLDHRGNGTYLETVRGLRLLQNSGISNLQDVGVICVIDPDTDARKTFDHFVDDLGLTSLHYLFPMDNHDTYDINRTKKMTKYLCDLFDAWVGRENPEINIRYFQRLLGKLLGGEEIITYINTSLRKNIAFTIASNGDIGPADDLRNTFPHLFWANKNVSDTSLNDFLRSPLINNHHMAMQDRHDDCKSCCWGNICDGGDLVGSEAFRYSNKHGFRNKSIYCESIDDLLTHMTKFSVKRGVSFERISGGLLDR